MTTPNRINRALCASLLLLLAVPEPRSPTTLATRGYSMSDLTTTIRQLCGMRA